MNLDAYRRIIALQRRSDALLVKTRQRAVYDELLATKTSAAEYNEEEELAATVRELSRYTEEPPKVTHEELVDYHTHKASELRALVDEFGAADFRDALAEAEAQLADLTRPEVRIITRAYERDVARESLDADVRLGLDLSTYFPDRVDADFTGREVVLCRSVRDTEGIPELLDVTAETVRGYAQAAGSILVRVRCETGRQWAVAFADRLVELLPDELTICADYLDEEAGETV